MEDWELDRKCEDAFRSRDHAEAVRLLPLVKEPRRIRNWTGIRVDRGIMRQHLLLVSLARPSQRLRILGGRRVDPPNIRRRWEGLASETIFPFTPLSEWFCWCV